ncbi:hypothetical protein [Stigmatella erecta]|nr:hypothetical protein [Stigmatella erecta]
MMAGGTGAAVAAVRRRRKRAQLVIPPLDLGTGTTEPEHGASPVLGGNPLAGVGDIAKGLLNGGALGTIGAGLKFADMQGKLIEALGGTEGQADTARVFGPIATMPILADMGTEKLLGAIGINDKNIQDKVGQAVGAGVIGGALVPGAVAVGAADLLLGAISKDAQKVVHDVFRPFDPTNPNALVGKGVAAVADVVEGGVGGVVKAGGAIVKGIGGAISGLFGGKKGPPPPMPDVFARPFRMALALKESYLPENKTGAEWQSGVYTGNGAGFGSAALAFQRDMSEAVRPGDFMRWSGASLMSAGNPARRQVREVHPQWKNVVLLDGPPLDPAEHGYPKHVWVDPQDEGEYSVSHHTDLAWRNGVLAAQAAEGFTPAALLFAYDMSGEAKPGRLVQWKDGVSRIVVGTHPEYPNAVLLAGTPVDPATRGFPESVRVLDQADGGYQVGDLTDANWLNGVLRTLLDGREAALIFPHPVDGIARPGMGAYWPHGGRRTVVKVSGTVVLLDGGPLPLEGHGFPGSVRFVDEGAVAQAVAQATGGVWGKLQAAVRAVAKP